MPKKVDYRARFLEARWDGLEAFDGAGLVAGLQAYIAAEGPIYPVEDRRLRALHEYLFEARPDPEALLPLIGPRAEATEVEDWMLRRDHVAMAVVTSLYRRLDQVPDDPHIAAIWDAVAYAGANFGFDPLYGEAHTRTGAEVADLFVDPKLKACPESRAALNHHMERLLKAWRGRVTEKATTTMMAIFLRHLGAPGMDRMFSEWDAMSPRERFNLLKLAADMEGPSTGTKRRIVDALLADSMEVREAAKEALEALGAPVGGLEVAAPERELERELEGLRRWAAETDS